MRIPSTTDTIMLGIKYIKGSRKAKAETITTIGTKMSLVI
jgi:hypothetical protein